MPKKVILGSSKKVLNLHDTPFASGGEGELFKILAPESYQDSVAKLYFKEKRTPTQEQKIKYLIENPPELTQTEGHQSVIWVEDILYDENEAFVGFVMPFAEGVKLEILCSSRIPKKYIHEWSRFSLKRPEARELRQKICFNIATAVYQIHKTQKYVLVDLKPDNIIIQPNGLVSIVDIDSVQVVQNGKLLYPARVATPEFSPPEYYGEAKPGKTIIYETWDRFGLAIIFYKLLFGIHPYAGSSLPPYDDAVNLQDKIKHGLFAHSPSKKDKFKVIPRPHDAFHSLPVHIQNLFIRCFEYGHSNTYERPTANEWCWGTTPRPPLIEMRKLPSMALPMKAIQYTPAISMSTKGDDIQLPKLQTIPPVTIRLQRFKGKFRLLQGIGVLSLLTAIYWVFVRDVPFTWMTTLQLFSIAVTNVLVAAVQYYSLPIVKEKSLAEQFKKKIGAEKREKRRSVNQLIRKMQRLPKAKIQGQKEFYQQQSNLLRQERLEIDAIANNYRTLVVEKDQRVIQLNQEELTRVQEAEGALLQKVDTAPIQEADFLPLPDKTVWLEQQIEKAEAASEQLKAWNELLPQLQSLSEEFDRIRGKIAEEYKKEHEEIQQRCQLAYDELSEKVSAINERTKQRKEELLKATVAHELDELQQSQEMIAQVKKEILELEDLHQNFNTVSNKLLEYKLINFKEFLRKAYLS